MASRLRLFLFTSDRSIQFSLRQLLGDKVELVRTATLDHLVDQATRETNALGVIVEPAAAEGGIAGLSRLRASRPALPIGILLGEADFSVGIDAVHAGACDATLYKPISVDALKACVSQLITARKSAAVAV